MADPNATSCQLDIVLTSVLWAHSTRLASLQSSVLLPMIQEEHGDSEADSETQAMINALKIQI